MGFLTDEFLFYGGIITAGVSAAALIVSLLMFRIGKLTLDSKLDAEYGERPHKNKKKGK